MHGDLGGRNRDRGRGLANGLKQRQQAGRGGLASSRTQPLCAALSPGRAGGQIQGHEHGSPASAAQPRADRAQHQGVGQHCAQRGRERTGQAHGPGPAGLGGRTGLFPVDALRTLAYVFPSRAPGATVRTGRDIAQVVEDIVVIPHCIIVPGREKSLLRRHPWIFSGAVAAVKGRPVAGQTVDVLSQGGQWLARAAFSPRSQIQARVWTFDAQEHVDADFFLRRIAQAAARRGELAADSDALRLVHSESDGLPGLILDRYAGALVFQLLTTGAEFWRGAIIEALRALWPEDAILERSDADVRIKEGLAERIAVVHGDIPPCVPIREHGVAYLVDVMAGHKTGFYLDQRDNRRAVARVAAGKRLLNCFCYTGGFGLAALAAGAAHVTQLDASAPALELAHRNRELNGFASETMTTVCGDAFQILRAWQREERFFDCIVLDPPKFVDSKASLARAARGYKDVNLCALRLLAPGGRLFTFSCSGLMEDGLFQKIVADAALDAGRTGRIVRRLAQAPDHPVALAFPEGAYLKGLEVLVE